ncbi:hypothetical protein FQN60_005274 [Etheostoma spectabile]|uniref:Uncharacterized protein n=1 Tax=Etheostoma spectabile TaxID=54343 RepID=A0A5J5CBZ9_9PERO|nr:hypothetical protein FQN60_005274 [Etheostoma spectabile]
MRDPVDTAAAMAYHPFQAHRPGALTLSAFFFPPLSPRLSLRLWLSQTSSPVWSLRRSGLPLTGAARCSGPPAHRFTPRALKSVQTEEGSTMTRKSHWNQIIYGKNFTNGNGDGYNQIRKEDVPAFKVRVTAG